MIIYFVDAMIGNVPAGQHRKDTQLTKFATQPYKLNPQLIGPEKRKPRYWSIAGFIREEKILILYKDQWIGDIVV